MQFVVERKLGGRLQSYDELDVVRQVLSDEREHCGKIDIVLRLLVGRVDDHWNIVRGVSAVTREVTELNGRQEKLRSDAVREQELLTSLDHQTRMADEALKAYNSDAAWIRKEGSEPLICPTCHAEHDKPFLDLLQFAEDARVLRELAARLSCSISASKFAALSFGPCTGTVRLKRSNVRSSNFSSRRCSSSTRDC